MNARQAVCISFELAAVVSVEEPEAMPLYYASLCSFCALTEHLIAVSQYSSLVVALDLSPTVPSMR
jgi:hypothetical protein